MPVKKSKTSKNLIPIFEELFLQSPNSRFMGLIKYKKQILSREVIKIGDRNHHVGLFSSRLNQTLVPYESSLEKDACAYFESQSEISEYFSQPMPIKLRFLNRRRTVYPDFLITNNGQHELIDIKYKSKTKSKLFLARYKHLSRYAEIHNYHYRLLTEEDIRTPRIDITRWLLSQARGLPSTALTETVHFWLKQLPSKYTYGDLWKISKEYSSVQAVIAGMILDGYLCADLDKPIFSQNFILNSGE